MAGIVNLDLWIGPIDVKPLRADAAAMTSAADSDRDRGDWLIPAAMTSALGICLLVFAPFAGDSVEDDRFWLAAFGAIWLASAGALAIREGRTMWSRPKAIAYHAVSFVAFVPHLLVGGLAMAVVSPVARAVVLDPGQTVGTAAFGVLLVSGLFMAWLGVTAWGLRSWVQRSWATLLVPVVSVLGLVATAVTLFALSGPGQH